MTAPIKITARHETHEAFIIANTRLLSPPLVPEIKLHLAEESVPIWLKTEEELGEINVPPPYWAFAWAGGQALARYLLDHPETCRAQNVIDLGAGSGLTAIAAAMTGAATVLAADIDAFALAACRLNAAANAVQFASTSADLLAAPFALPPSPASVILVGDLFYEKTLADRVLAYIDAAKANGTAVYIGDPQRNYFPRDRFTLLASYQVPVTRDLEDSEIKKTAVWRA
jgi:predicted nicotinamide N-methyase